MTLMLRDEPSLDLAHDLRDEPSLELAHDVDAT